MRRDAAYDTTRHGRDGVWWFGFGTSLARARAGWLVLGSEHARAHGVGGTARLGAQRQTQKQDRRTRSSAAGLGERSLREEEGERGYKRKPESKRKKWGSSG